MSPFRPFSPPQPRVYSRNQRLLSSYAPRNANISSILNILRILSVATGVSLPRHSPSIPLPSLCSLRPCLPRPARGGKSHVFSSLPPLEISLRSFSHSLPLFSIACALFYKNTRDGGWASLIRLLDSRRESTKTPGAGDASTERRGVGHPDPTFGLSLGGDAPGAAQPEEASSVYASAFRINTYKSVSKQATLTTFRINTYRKPRGRGWSK